MRVPMADPLQETADALARAMRDGTSTMPIPEALLADPSAAYALQERVRAALGEPMAGWKIGATNAKAQTALATDRPFFGPIPTRRVHPDGATIDLPEGCAGAEIELAFRLAQPLPRRDAPYSEGELIEAIENMHPAIELIGLRQEKAGPLTALRAIADFGAHVAFVAGPAIDGWNELDPGEITARCMVDGRVAGEGRASGVLGGPLVALAWLADHGPGLDAGAWISTGTITGLAAVAPGAEVVGDFGAQGQVRLSFRP
ncbi:MAG: fumarylacetoacetate hydrolase family protein [Geminicoccaceae bacterium]|nr:fumarylacetoacetate hydrolase family protein [Geminicoccaceae bacterium]